MMLVMDIITRSYWSWSYFTHAHWIVHHSLLLSWENVSIYIRFLGIISITVVIRDKAWAVILKNTNFWSKIGKLLVKNRETF